MKTKSRRGKKLQKKQLPSTSSTLPIKSQQQIAVRTELCPTANTEMGFDFDFRFAGRCPITTCQYHSHNAKRTHCMMLDVNMNSKDFTDAELHHYKFEQNPEIPANERPKPRTVNLIRKKAVSRIKHNIIFYDFLEYVRNNCGDLEQEFEYTPGSCRQIDTLLGEFPFNQPGLDIFHSWMLPALFDFDLYLEFCEKSETLQITPSDFNLQSVLDITPIKFFKLKKLIESNIGTYSQEN
jgi:hypothetical protein